MRGNPDPRGIANLGDDDPGYRLDTLPAEVRFEIFDRLDLRSLRLLTQVSRSLHDDVTGLLPVEAMRLWLLKAESLLDRETRDYFALQTHRDEGHKLTEKFLNQEERLDVSPDRRVRFAKRVDLMIELLDRAAEAIAPDRDPTKSTGLRRRR